MFKYKMRQFHLVQDVKPGEVFKYLDGQSMSDQTQFIKLDGTASNVVNVATWVAAYVHPETLVEVIGSLVKQENP